MGIISRMGGRALIGLAALAAACAAAAPAARDEAAFTAEVAERLRAALPGRPFRIIGPLQIGAEAEGYESMTINVGRIFNYCAAATGEECEASRAQFVSSIVDALSAQPAPIVREQLRVTVRSADFCRALAAPGGPPARLPLSRAGPGAGLCAVLMADYPTRMATVAGEDLVRLRLDPQAAWALAERQTLAGLPAPDRLEGLDTSLVAVTEMDYVPSLLLDREGWRRAAARGGELIVAVPSDGFMIVARRANVTDMAEFQRVTRDGFETSERGISPLVYRWTEAGWTPVE